MLRGYIRPDARISVQRQREALVAIGCTMFYVEHERRRGDSFPERDDWISHLRKPDEACVAVFNRLAIGKNDLAATLKAIFAKGIPIIEAETGRRSDNQESLVDMIAEATGYYARHLDSEEAVRRGKLGAAASPVTKRRKGRMPEREALKFLNDRAKYRKLKDAVAAINKDKRYPTPWSVPLVYRLKKLGLRVRGRQSKK